MHDNHDFSLGLRDDLDAGNVVEWAEIYALDAVSDAERAQIDDHLATCPETTKAAFYHRLRRGRETLTLAYGHLEAQPPADLRDAILDRLPARRDDSSAVTDLDSRRSGRGSGGRPAHRRQRSGPSRWTPAKRWIASAAAAALIALGGAAVVQNLVQPPSVQEQISQASDVHRKTVTLPEGGTAEVAASHDVDAAMITFSDVSAPRAGHVYQMWRIPADGSNPVPAGLVTAEDLSTPAPRLLKNIDNASAIAITVEPQGGSKQPTTKPIAAIPLT